MSAFKPTLHRARLVALIGSGALASTAPRGASAQAMVTETRDPAQTQDTAFVTHYREWTGDSIYGSPLVDHLPIVAGIPSPREVLGYDIGAPRRLTYYADIVRYYRALAKATPRVKVETIGYSDEGRELVVVWVSSDENMRNLQHNRDNLAKLADPRGLSAGQIKTLLATTKPDYHLFGGLHSGETGPSEMLMELVYRLATETSPLITRIRDNVYVSVTPVADADGRDRNVDWFYHSLDVDSTLRADSIANPDSVARADSASRASGGGRGGFFFRRSGAGSLPYWGKYVFHDNNRDINLSLVQMRDIANWYFTAHPPIMHDLHESLSLMYIYSGGPPQNPNLDPILFAELPWYSNFEMAQMTKWGMPGVYDHAFMDAWSPGYLGSIAYNHNGMMLMYETQSGRDLDTAAKPTAAKPARRDSAKSGGPPRASRSLTRGRDRQSSRTVRDSTSQAGNVAAISARATSRSGSTNTAPSGTGTFDAPRGGTPTGKGGTQPREWYRGLPIPDSAIAHFTRRDNTNYMETGILSALQLTAMFPNIVLQNFYLKTQHSIDDWRHHAPAGYLIPVRADMTRAVELVNILRLQGIEVGLATRPVTVGDSTWAAGSYVIKRNQPYGRLLKNLLEKQTFPDSRLSTYDDSGWSMGLEMLVDVVPVPDSAILNVPVTTVAWAHARGSVTGHGTAGIAIADHGSNNMISFRYQMRNLPMRIAEQGFVVGHDTLPAGSFVIAGDSAAATVRQLVDSLGLTAVQLDSSPTVPMHAANPPRIAIYSEWGNTQDLGWYRLTFDNFHVPYDLIFKDRVAQGDLRRDYDVILMADQRINKRSVMQKSAAHPQPYQQSDKYRFLGMYGSTPDMSGGFGQKGVDAFSDFLDRGGTLIAIGDAIHFPIEFGWAGTADTSAVPGLESQNPIVQGVIVKRDNPLFYGYADSLLPVKYVGGPSLRVGVADEGHVLAKYQGGDASVLSGLMTGADALKNRPFAVDIPQANHGHGRVILFTNNPIYRWQNHGEFGMVFNALMNWDDVKK